MPIRTISLVLALACSCAPLGTAKRVEEPVFTPSNNPNPKPRKETPNTELPRPWNGLILFAANEVMLINPRMQSDGAMLVNQEVLIEAVAHGRIVGNKHFDEEEKEAEVWNFQIPDEFGVNAFFIRAGYYPYEFMKEIYDVKLAVSRVFVHLRHPNPRVDCIVRVPATRSNKVKITQKVTEGRKDLEEMLFLTRDYGGSCKGRDCNQCIDPSGLVLIHPKLLQSTSG